MSSAPCINYVLLFIYLFIILIFFFFFFSFLHAALPEASINVVNILPRRTRGCCDVVNAINTNIELLCKRLERLHYIDTFANNMFSNKDGSRRNEFFKPGRYFGDDDVHLNSLGIVRLGKYLKFLAHNT